jgi:outer membrane immunogenic protein
MKKLFLSAAALTLLVAPALAADIAVRPATKAPAMVAPATYNWTGIYTASSVGGAWWEVDGAYVLPPPDRHNVDANRGIYGSHLGAQYQWNNIVLGVEGSYLTNFDRAFEAVNGGTPDCIASNAARQCQARIDRIWTAGARLGLAWDRLMVYGTGGYASGRVQTHRADLTGLFLDTSSERHSGWFAGVGAEFFVTKFFWSDLILGVEYQHIDLDTERHLAAVPATIATRDISATIDTIRARLVFKYGVGGDVVRAAY